MFILLCSKLGTFSVTVHRDIKLSSIVDCSIRDIIVVYFHSVQSQ